MKMIAQILLSLALSLGVTTAFNGSVRGKVDQAIQRVEGTVTQATDFAAQTLAHVSVGASAQTSTNANANVSSASGKSGAEANLTSVVNNLFNGQSRSNASASANVKAQASASATSNSGSFLDLLFGGQSEAGAGLSFGQ